MEIYGSLMKWEHYEYTDVTSGRTVSYRVSEDRGSSSGWMVRKSFFFFFFFFSFFFFFFLALVFIGPHPWHMEVLRLGVKLELQLLAYTTATATPDLSRVCDLHHSSWQHQILNPLSKARDRTCVLMGISQICFPWARMRIPDTSLFFFF